MAGKGESHPVLARSMPRLEQVLEVSILVWVLTGILLGIPHGPGHSIESMVPVHVLNAMALRVGLGSFAAMIAQLALQSYRWLATRTSDERHQVR